MMLYLRTSVDDFRVTQLCSVLSGVLICMFLSNAFFQAGFVFSVAFFSQDIHCSYLAFSSEHTHFSHFADAFECRLTLAGQFMLLKFLCPWQRGEGELVKAKPGMTSLPHPIRDSTLAINLFVTAKLWVTTKAGGQLH